MVIQITYYREMLENDYATMDKIVLPATAKDLQGLSHKYMEKYVRHYVHHHLKQFVKKEVNISYHPGLEQKQGGSKQSSYDKRNPIQPALPIHKGTGI